MTQERQPYSILGIGDACIDLLLPVSDEFVSHFVGKKGGAQAIDREHLNQIISESGAKPHVIAGGSCANTLKGLANLGESCALISRIGDDSFGEHFTLSLNQLGIVTLLSRTKSPTPCVLCLVTPDGQRTMRFFSEVEGRWLEEYLQPKFFKGVKIVHFDAYSLRHGNLVDKAIKLAREAQATVSIDLSSFEIATEFHAKLTELLSHGVDIVFANKEETHAFTGLPPIKGCLKLQEMCSIAVVLMGEKGCLVGHQGNFFHSPAYPAQMVDSIGAGDLFASGFLYGYLHGYPLEKCARLGNRLGSAIVEVQGAEFSPEKWEIIRAALLKESLLRK